VRDLLSLDLETTSGKETFPVCFSGRGAAEADVAIASRRGVRHFLGGAGFSMIKASELAAELAVSTTCNISCIGLVSASASITG